MGFHPPFFMSDLGFASTSCEFREAHAPSTASTTQVGPRRQIDIATARKILGLIGRNYSDAQLEEALALLRGLSELVYHHLETGKHVSGSSSQGE